MDTCLTFHNRLQNRKDSSHLAGTLLTVMVVHKIYGANRLTLLVEAVSLGDPTIPASKRTRLPTLGTHTVQEKKLSLKRTSADHEFGYQNKSPLKL